MRAPAFLSNPRLRRLAVLAPLMLGLCASCGKGSRVRGPTTTFQENTDRAPLPAEQVTRIESKDRPTLQLLERLGDPASAVGLALFTQGSRDAVFLAALLQKRLLPDHPVLTLRSHGLGVVIASEVTGASDAAAFVEHAASALVSPVTRDEVRTLGEGTMLRALAARTKDPSPHAECMGELGHEGVEALTDELKDSELEQRARRLETARQALGASRLGLSAVGTLDVLSAVKKAHARPWPQNGRIVDAWSPEETVAVVESAGGRELRLALRLGDSEAALATARSLDRPDHPYRARLAGLSPHFSGSTAVTLRPSGACLGLNLTFASEATAPSAELLAQASVSMLEELVESAESVVPEEERNLALLSPEGAVEAAALAAWTAVRTSRIPTEWKQIIEYRSPASETVGEKAFAQALRETRSEWAERTLPTRARDERGQAELWLLAATPCGTIPESSDRAGLRALTVGSLALQFDGRAGVHLLPWVSHSGVGLIAHAPPLRGESPTRHAERVSRALGAALLGAQLDGRAVAEARARQLTRIGNDPGLDLLTDLLGGAHPSELRPYGLERSVATLSVADVERTRGDLVSEPLELAVLSNGSTEQSRVASGALARWLAPARSQVEACPRPQFEPSPAKQWSLESIEDGVEPSALVSVATTGPAELGHATAYLLNQGDLQRALDRPGLVTSAHAVFLGGDALGALVIQLGADRESMDAAIAQVRTLLARYSEGAVQPQQAQVAARHFERLRRETARSPQGRLVELWLEPRPFQMTLQGLRTFHQQLGETAHRIVRVKKRR